MAEGIVKDNRIIRRTESFLTPQTLRDRFLFGIVIEDDNGKELPDSTLQDYIDIATSMLEHELDINIAPREFSGDDTEEKDYQANQYYNWSFFQLNNYPVIEVKEVRAVYPNASILTYPTDWFKLQKHDGILRLIPSSGTLAQFMIDSGGNYFPEIFRHQGFVPLVWQIDYISGMADGCIPHDVNAAIGMMASIIFLIVGGPLVLGAGIGAESISIDGLSQNIQTTQSAENSSYSATIKEYQRLLYGESINSPDRGLIRTLRDFYKGGPSLDLI